jgi:hypothetical protein
MNAVEQLKSVLCDPEGKCCITGSDEDRATVDRALQTLAAPVQPEQEPVAIPDEVRKIAQAMKKAGYRGPLAWAEKVIDFVADYTPSAAQSFGYAHWEERIKDLMKQVGMPNSVSLAGAMNQLVNEMMQATPPAAPVQEPVPENFMDALKFDVAARDAREWDALYNTPPAAQPAQPPYSVQQAYAMAQVCLDLHEALGCKWGDNVYLTISQLKAAHGIKEKNT